MKIISFPPAGFCGEICYLVTENKSAALIDAPGNNDRILNRLKEEDCELKLILLTHGHFDHISGLAEIAEETSAEVYISNEDKKLLYDDYLNLAEIFGAPSVKKYEGRVNTFSDGDEIPFEGKKFRVMSTPGHTEGSVLFVIENAIFSGDTLFAGSIGRTDMPGGDLSEMKKSLRKIAAANFGDYENYTVYSGHTEPTDLNSELRHNPYLKGTLDYDNLL